MLKCACGVVQGSGCCSFGILWIRDTENYFVEFPYIFKNMSPFMQPNNKCECHICASRTGAKISCSWAALMVTPAKWF